MINNAKAIPSEEHRNTTLAWLGGSLAVALLVRLALWLNYSAVAFSDTASYRRSASSILNYFAHYDGTRTPGYPAFLALVGEDSNVWLIQMILGVLISLILFYLGWQLSGRGWFAALLSLAHTLNLGQLFFEAHLLTETLTTFYLAVTLLAVSLLLRQKARFQWGLALSASLAGSLALLTRPLFVFLPVWVGVFTTWVLSNSTFLNRGLRWRTGFARLAVFAMPVLLLVGGWVLFIHQRFGDLGLTTMTGYHLVQNTGDYFEYVPDEYAELRDTYIQYRDAKIAASGNQTNTIWDAIPEMSRVSGLNFYQLSHTLARISVRLILEHPELFLANVIEGWWLFWIAPVYWSPAAIQSPGLVGIISGLVIAQRVILVTTNIVFVAGSLLWALVSILPSKIIERLPGLFCHLRLASQSGDNTKRLFLLFTASTIWFASILQCLLDHGDNPRFLVPLQSFVVLWVAWFILQLVRLEKVKH